MDNGKLSLRKELAYKLLNELKRNYEQLDQSAEDVTKNSEVFYEKAFEEKREELQAIMKNYQKNVDRIREINNEITASINSWYEFTTDKSKSVRIIFPLLFLLKKKRLYKKIELLNREISEITINNRFVKEKLTVLGHQLEIRAVSLARSGEDFLGYEKLLYVQKAITAELKYLLPSIPGMYTADISSSGILHALDAVTAQ